MDTWSSLFDKLIDHSPSLRDAFETFDDSQLKRLMSWLTLQFVFMGDSFKQPPLWGYDSQHPFPPKESEALTSIWLNADANACDELSARLFSEYSDCFEDEDFEYVPLVYQLFDLAARGVKQIDLSAGMNWGGDEDHYIPRISFDSIAFGEGNLAVSREAFRYVGCKKCYIKDGGHLLSFIHIPPVDSPICDIDVYDKTVDRPVVIYYYDVCPKIINITCDSEMPQIEPMRLPNLPSCAFKLNTPIDIYWYPKVWETGAVKRAAQLFNQTIPTHNNLSYLTFHLPKAIKSLITNPEIKKHIVYR